jgi:hypothetical protein
MDWVHFSGLSIPFERMILKRMLSGLFLFLG